MEGLIWLSTLVPDAILVLHDCVALQRHDAAASTGSTGNQSAASAVPFHQCALLHGLRVLPSACGGTDESLPEYPVRDTAIVANQAVRGEQCHKSIVNGRYHASLEHLPQP